SIRWDELAADPEQRLDGSGTGRVRVTPCVLGLSGADSPLPLYHVEDLVLGDEPSRVQAAFLDVFHNRLTALLYRARVKLSPPREYLCDARDPLSSRVLRAVGVDVDPGEQHRERPPSPGPARAELLGLAALLATGGGTARSIENALRCLLAGQLRGVALSLEQLRGGWIGFDPQQRTSLGRRNCALADSWILGTRVRHPAHRARVVVGPMSPGHAREFSPGQPAFDKIRGVVHALCNDPIAVDLELLIDQDSYPPFVLRAVGGRVLGQDVFLSSRRREGRLLRKLFTLEPPAADWKPKSNTNTNTKPGAT
ncbi:MAG: type VI secretion system baseplate subunit TssG, partial [Deltaproteobacteria bacterium]|nr:type VI secretion system baseplate subunit TssG [Deltaproteobacteria bacterium]